jgi:hypothetical protein
MDSTAQNQDRNYGRSSYLYVRGKPFRALVKFDLSDLPAGSMILSASLELYKWFGVAEDGRTYTANRLTSPWMETGVTWRERDGVNSWGARGGDFTTEDAAAVVVPDGGGWVNWDVTAMVEGWVSGSHVNHGFLLKDRYEDGDVNKYAAFWSREYGSDPSRRPRLVVEYIETP